MIVGKCIALGLLVVGLIGSMPLVSADPPRETELIRLGMAKSFFNDIPKLLVDFVIDPFKPMMKTTTGLDGELFAHYDAFEMAQKLNDKQLHLGVFHGHEFAWVQQKYPELRPLMVAMNKYRDVRVYLIVKNDNPAKSIADLRGKNLALPLASKEHCRVFLERMCTDNAQPDPKAFATIVKSGSCDAALDDVCRGKMQGAIVDTNALEHYKEYKEYCFKNNLRILQQSPSFPAAVIAHKLGVLSDETLAKFTGGLERAHTSEVGLDMMKMWKIAAFERIPADYTRQLADILKVYPSPEATKVSLR